MSLESKLVEDFETKKQLKEYIRGLIHSLGVCASLKTKNSQSYFFFRELFQRHPEKDKKKTDRIVDIRIAKHKKSDYQFTVIWDDMESDTISWTSCVTQKSQTYATKLKQAFRIAIQDQISKFREKHHREVCGFCGSTDDLTVDHVIHFVKLVDDFKNIHSATTPILVKNEFQQNCFQDISYETAFKKYHRQHAELRILCRQCNVNRAKPDRNHIPKI